MLYGTVTLNSTAYKIAETGFSDTHYFDPYIVDFSPPNYKIRNLFGGYCELSFGSIGFSPDLFINEWPPPINGVLLLAYTDTTEAAGNTIISSTIHLNETAITKDCVGYDLYEVEYSTDLLSEVTDYDGNEDTPLPRAFGSVAYQIPIRLEDVVGCPTYHKASISGTLAKSFSAIADNGSSECRFTCDGHGFSTGNDVIIEGADRQYNGTYSITDVDTNTFDITSLTYVSTTTGHAYKDGYWGVYDDGVPISCNVTDNGDGTFSLSASPVGEVSISGDGEDTTLSDIFDWACGTSYLNLTYNNDKARVVSPEAGYWEGSQTLLIDFLSNISAYFTHLFYISGTTLYLVDMFISNDSRSIDEFEYYTSTYIYQSPIKSIEGKWITREAVEETIGKYVKSNEEEIVIQSSYLYGGDMNLTAYQNNRDNINTAFDNILTIIHKAGASIEMPLQGDLPAPGEKIFWTDESLIVSTDMYIRCRSISYNPLNDVVIVTGEGAVSMTGADVDTFIFTIETTSINETFTLPLETTGTYNFTVNWGDGSDSDIIIWDSANTTHGYTNIGIYELKITGKIKGFCFNNTGDKDMIQQIKEWGILELGNTGHYFYGCSNLTVTAIDILNISDTTTLKGMFKECSSLTALPSRVVWVTSNITDMSDMFYNAQLFNGDIVTMDTSSVTTMENMFYNAVSFNRNVGSFDITSVINMTEMFEGVTLSIHNYSYTLAYWEAQAVQDNVVFDGGNSKYAAGAAAARAALIADHSWTITDGGQV